MPGHSLPDIWGMYMEGHGPAYKASFSLKMDRKSIYLKEALYALNSAPVVSFN